MKNNRTAKPTNGGAETPSAADYVRKDYELNRRAIDDLVEADVSNTPKYSEEELNRYRSHRAFPIADWVKVLFIKFWFAGAVCFFFFWGLGSYLGTLVDQLFVMGMAMGIITDLLTNNLIRFFEKTPGDYDRFMMFPKKQYRSFFFNIVYAYVLLFFVYTIYQMINAAAALLAGRPDRIFLGVEPVLFGLFYLGMDLLFLCFKRLIKQIVNDAKKRV